MNYLKYSDISLVPRYSECMSRSDCSTEVKFGNNKFKLPVVPSNMKSVINFNLAKWMSKNNYFYIMHRFDHDLRDFVSTANKEQWNNISFSCGVKSKDKKLIDDIAIKKYRVDYITIDIAHGHSIRMKQMIRHIKSCLNNVTIIAGNVATQQAVVDLYSWGADYVKVGIGQGSPCTTKDKTGFTMPMFSCVSACSNLYSGGFDENDPEVKIPIIADGGIKCNGDIAKALSAGACMVMAGGLFAACSDSPAAFNSVNGSSFKAYFGSASFENTGNKNHVEGKLTNIPGNNMTYSSKLLEIHQDLQSAISYSGGTDLSIFNKVESIVV